MDINSLKNFIEINIKRLHYFEENGEPLQQYELGKLNAFEQVLMLLDVLDENKK